MKLSKQPRSARMEHFGRIVRELRTDRGLSQVDLAGKIDKSFQSVSKIERGKQSVLSEDVFILCDALDCSTEELFTRD